MCVRGRRRLLALALPSVLADPSYPHSQLNPVRPTCQTWDVDMPDSGVWEDEANRVCSGSEKQLCLLYAQAYPGAGTPAYIYNWENSGPAVALLLARATDYKVRCFAAPVVDTKGRACVVCKVCRVHAPARTLQIAGCCLALASVLHHHPCLSSCHAPAMRVVSRRHSKLTSNRTCSFAGIGGALGDLQPQNHKP